MKFYTSIVIQTIFFSGFLNKLRVMCISYCSILSFIILLGYLSNLLAKRSGRAFLTRFSSF
jgi:hypothetical protein